MKTQNTPIVLIAITAGFAAFLATTTANAQGLVAFAGNIAQSRLISQTCNAGVCDSVFEGSGSVNIMGPVTWTVHVTQDFNGYPCNPAVITEGTLVGATGSITIADTSGTVCPSATHFGVPYTIESVWNVTGGTGEFSGTIGSGTNQGTIGGQGPNVHLSGIVVY